MICPEPAVFLSSFAMEIWLKLASVFETSILILLFALSIWSISIMIDRRRTLKAERLANSFAEASQLISAGDLGAIKSWAESRSGVLAGTVKAALSQKEPLKIDRAVRSYLSTERIRLEKGFPVLATLGANAPFIGLFGTVLGIIRSFSALGNSAAGASSVMSGISLALFATAAGLFVAIPAVVAFNTFANGVRRMISQCDAIKDQIVALYSVDR